MRRSPSASCSCSSSSSATVELRAGPEDEGARVDAFLAAPLGSRTRAQRLIREGRVAVGGRAVPARHRLAAGDVVAVELPPEPEPVADLPPAPFATPYEDEHLLVV